MCLTSGWPISARNPTAYSEWACLFHSPIVGLTKAWFEYAAAVSNLAPRTTIPRSFSATTRSSTSGSWSCGHFDRSPLGSVLADTWNGSCSVALRTCLTMFSENAGLILFSTSWPSASDHISPTVSSPTLVTTPPAWSRMVSTPRRLACQSSLVIGGLEPMAQVSPLSSSTYVIVSLVNSS
jgi:hypothetical protein